MITHAFTPGEPRSHGNPPLCLICGTGPSRHAAHTEGCVCNVCGDCPDCDNGTRGPAGTYCLRCHRTQRP